MRRNLGGSGALAALVLTAVCSCGASEDGGDPAEVDAAAGAIDAAMADAAPADEADAAPRSVRVAVISDLNDSYGSTTYGSAVHGAVARLVALAPDVVLSTGDMVAGQQGGLDYGAMWSGFHAAVSSPLAAAGIPLAVSPGNHDASAYSSFAGERAEYVSQWSARRPAVTMLDDTHYPLRYSFAVGHVLFLALDSTTVGALDAAQMTWIDQQLTAHGGDHAVSVVYGHVPLYPFAQGRETEVIGDAALESMLVGHGVDLFVSGHHHAYYPGRKGALRLVSMACLGSGPRKLVGDAATSSRSVLVFDITEDRIVALDAYGGGGFDQAIDRATLPASIGAIVRDDL